MDAQALPTDIPPQLITEGAGKKAHLPVSPWKGRDCTLSQLLAEVPISLHVGADWNTPTTLKVLVSHLSCRLSPVKPSQLLPGINLSNCYGCHLSGQPPNHLALEAVGGTAFTGPSAPHKGTQQLLPLTQHRVSR